MRRENLREDPPSAKRFPQEIERHKRKQAGQSNSNVGSARHMNESFVAVVRTRSAT